MTHAPTVRLATFDIPAVHNALSIPNREPPSILVSFVYLEAFLKHRHNYHIADWALDSGAFSAYNSGTTIDLKEYIDTCLHLTKTDDQLVDVFALDVIGNWRASQKNTDLMWEAGVSAIPTYHAGEPEKVLVDLAKRYPKIGLGGVATLRGKKKLQWAAQSFARVYPKKIHGLGFASRNAVLGLPFHSTDATSWEIGPAKFGTWASYGGANLSIRGSNHPLRAEVNHYLQLQRDARSRWKTEMTRLENLDNEQ